MILEDALWLAGGTRSVCNPGEAMRNRSALRQGAVQLVQFVQIEDGDARAEELRDEPGDLTGGHNCGCARMRRDLQIAVDGMVGIERDIAAAGRENSQQ